MGRGGGGQGEVGERAGGADRLAELLRDEPDAGDASHVEVGRHRSRRDKVALLSVPESLRSVELRVGWGAVRGMLLVAVVVLLVVGGRWLWVSVAAERAEPVHLGGEAAPAPAETGVKTEPGPEASPPADDEQETGRGTTQETEAEPAVLLVHVAGQVREPGVVEVETGARVIDVVRQAGGFTSEADQSVLNLARPVVDGEQVWVGRPGEDPPVSAGVPASTGTGGGPGGGGGGTGQGGAGSGGGGPLDLNQASQADLEELPGVGPVTAERILAWREENGRFSSVEELLEVSGIGERTLAQLAPLVTVG